MASIDTINFTGTNATACQRTAISNPLNGLLDDSYILFSAELNDTAIAKCCEENSVNLISNCFVWCYIPRSYLGSRANPKTQDEISSAFRSCVTSERRRRNDSGLLSSVIFVTPLDLNGTVPTSEGSSMTGGSGNLGRMLLVGGLMWLLML